MPTYDYVCDACGHEFEHFQPMTSDPLKKCDECGKPKLRRLIGAGAAIVFKGSGFYQTDYRSDSYKKHAAADKSSSSDNGKSSDSGSNSGESNGGESKAAEKKAESKPAASSDKGSKKKKGKE